MSDRSWQNSFIVLVPALRRRVFVVAMAVDHRVVAHVKRCGRHLAAQHREVRSQPVALRRRCLTTPRIAAISGDMCAELLPQR